jgi:23S rRNA pseudouridine2457 synthase
LLLLTTNKNITRLLFESSRRHLRTYHVMVKNKVNAENLQRLRNGVRIRISTSEYYTTPPCEVHLIPPPANRPLREGEVVRNVPHTWLSITITEGKYRQVRKMVAAISHPCMRLIRVAIEDIGLGNIAAGAVKEMKEEEFFRLLKLDMQNESAK